jgi:hypothetical protein
MLSKECVSTQQHQKTLCGSDSTLVQECGREPTSTKAKLSDDSQQRTVVSGLLVPAIKHPTRNAHLSRHCAMELHIGGCAASFSFFTVSRSHVLQTTQQCVILAFLGQEKRIIVLSE